MLKYQMGLPVVRVGNCIQFKQVRDLQQRPRLLNQARRHNVMLILLFLPKTCHQYLELHTTELVQNQVMPSLVLFLDLQQPMEIAHSDYKLNVRIEILLSKKSFWH